MFLLFRIERKTCFLVGSFCLIKGTVCVVCCFFWLKICFAFVMCCLLQDSLFYWWDLLSIGLVLCVLVQNVQDLSLLEDLFLLVLFLTDSVEQAEKSLELSLG